MSNPPDVQPNVAQVGAAGARVGSAWPMLLLVLVVSLGVRLGWLLLVPVEPVSDSTRYDFFAQRIAQGLGYSEADGSPTAYWPVGPSALYAIPYALVGPECQTRLVAAAYVNLGLGVAVAVLTAALGRRWLGPRSGLAAGLLVAVWPAHVQFTTVLNSETPMLAFMLAGIAAWSSWRSSAAAMSFNLRTATLIPIAALCFAAAAYMRPTALLVPPLLVLIDLISQPRRVRTLGTGFAMGVLMAAAIAPWTYRNYRVFDAFVPISTNGGVNFWMGNNPQSDGDYMSPEPAVAFGGEAQRDDALKAEAFAYIRDEPLAFAQRTVIKAVRLHERESIGVAWNEPGLRQAIAARAGGDWVDRVVFGLKLGSNLYWWGILAAAVVGVVLLLRRRGVSQLILSPPLVFWTYFALIHAITVVQDRYHFAAAPFIAMLAAFAIVPTGSPRQRPRASADARSAAA